MCRQSDVGPVQAHPQRSPPPPAPSSLPYTLLAPSLGPSASPKNTKKILKNRLKFKTSFLCAVLLCCWTVTHTQVRAASDLKALARLIPTEARLVLDPSGEPAASSSSSADVEYALVQTSSVRPGDILRVLPGKGCSLAYLVLLIFYYCYNYYYYC